MKIIYIDTETTGLYENKNAIIQLSGIIEINGEEKESFNYYITPFSNAIIEKEALAVTKKTIEELYNDEKYVLESVAYEKFLALLDKYIDKYNKDDKFIVAGYNVKFDMGFLKNFFLRQNNKFMYSYFEKSFLDPLGAISFLQHFGILPILENNKLGTWCEYFKIPLDAHDSLEDIVATRELIKKMGKLLKK